MLGALLLVLQAATLPAATEVRRMPAPEAHQGVVADRTYVYAISNAEIGKYDRRTGKRIARWQGDPTLFVHMNSCVLNRAEIVCAASNYPDVPQASSVEWFDTRSMRHMRSHSFGPGRGSLTWLDWHKGSWWACFANYDAKGGEPGRDHRYTTLVRFDATFHETGAWLFPQDVLDRFAPYSSSGGAWGTDDLLYVTGHDRPELYVLTLPEAGSRLIHKATIAIPTPGQAIAWDAAEPRLLWSIDRRGGQMVASRIPAVR
ncbi:hypothetical protein [Sphingomonas alpina]|nr:hypothetical protein [Sphingomonas alpina]